MKYSKVTSIKDSKMEMTSRTIPQSQLTSECWTIQFEGLSACEHCSYKNTKECGGKEIRKKLLNIKGYKVPLGNDIKKETKVWN